MEWLKFMEAGSVRWEVDGLLLVTSMHQSVQLADCKPRYAYNILLHVAICQFLGLALLTGERLGTEICANIDC